MTDNIEQQTVGGEDVRATLIKLVDDVRAVMVTGPCSDERIEEIAALVSSAEQLISRHYIAKKTIEASEAHELLMAYGKACIETGLLSERSVTIRMDLATLIRIYESDYIAKEAVANVLTSLKTNKKTYWDHDNKATDYIEIAVIDEELTALNLNSDTNK